MSLCDCMCDGCDLHSYPDEWLTNDEIGVLLFLLDKIDDGDPLKHHDSPITAYRRAASARGKMRRTLKRRQP